jgi:hypothetical protein
MSIFKREFWEQTRLILGLIPLQFYNRAIKEIKGEDDDSIEISFGQSS